MVHVVEGGETLRRIAEQHRSSVAAFIEANPDIDPDRIYPGQRLNVPDGAEPATGSSQRATSVDAQVQPDTQATVTVSPGDTLGKIAETLGVSLSELIETNPQLVDPDAIRPGDVLYVPGGTSTLTSGTARPADGRDGAVAPGDAGPMRDWTGIPKDDRMLYVMERLVGYGYPVKGAAGITGNIYVESGVLPSRLERSKPATPLCSLDFAGHEVDFSPEEVMRRDADAKRGPQYGGIGLAQWTYHTRRDALFGYEYDGMVLGSKILLHMDAQLDFLVDELRHTYTHVDEIVGDPGVTVDRAADEVVYCFEKPAAVAQPSGRLRPRSDPEVQRVFAERRIHAHRADAIYRNAGNL